MIEINKNKYASQYYFAGKYVNDYRRYEFTLEILYNEDAGEHYEVTWLDHIPNNSDKIEEDIIQQYKNSI